MDWKHATINALSRMSLRHKTNTFSRSQIINEELDKIIYEVRSIGKTPHQTLSRVLQNLRDEGFLEFEGSGTYRLLTSSEVPFSKDIPSEYQIPDRIPSTVHRIVRDTTIAGKLKRLYRYKCQICEQRLELCSGFYCEAHHLKPLGMPHNGPDSTHNIVIVCPNHHVLLDYGALSIRSSTFMLLEHNIDSQFISYHNSICC